jgi:hypothetical protein
MKFLAREQDVPGFAPEAYAPFLKDEAKMVLRLYEKGIIREIYFASPSHEAVIILECPTIDTARESLSQLPLVRSGLIAFQIEELVAYNGFSRLLE